jgi:hypothetical protein
MVTFHSKYIANSEVLQPDDYNKELQIAIKTTKESKLDARQLLILQPLVKFYSKQRNMYILINILNGSSIISLRLIEYFVVNYVLKNKLKFNKAQYKSDLKYLVNNINGEVYKKKHKNIENTYENILIVHDNYKSQLKQYNKKNFDPFCRSHRIKLFYDTSDKDNHYFDTTVAQLNFFKWAISNHILDYILDNLETIEEAMSIYEKKIKQEKKTKKTTPETGRRTKTKFVKINKQTMRINCPRVIKFD